MDKNKLSTTENMQVNVFKIMVYRCASEHHLFRPGESATSKQNLDADEPRTMTMRQIIQIRYGGELI